jgi:hypothetical protein
MNSTPIIPSGPSGQFARFHVARGATLTALALLTGCGRDGLNLAPVTGVVTMDGKPVAEASVIFAPNDSKAGPPAIGATNEQGAFTLVTANRPGAVVGEHRVAVSKSEATVIPQRRGLPIYRVKEALPPKFGSVETSGLTATVRDDDNQLEVKLSAP